MWKAALFAVLQIFIGLTVAAFLLPIILIVGPNLLGPTSMLVVIGACVLAVFGISDVLERRRKRGE